MIIICSLGSLLGATALNQFATLPHSVLISMVFWSSLAGLCTTKVLVNKLLIKRSLFLGLSILLGFSWAAMQAQSRLSWQLPAQDHQRPVPLAGKIYGIPQRQPQGWRFDMDLSNVGKARVRLFWKNTTVHLQAGDRVQCQGKLRHPWHFANPGSVDLQKLLFIENIRATGTVVQMQLITPRSTWSIARYRQQISEKIAKLLIDYPMQGILQALTVGVRNDITPAQWKIFQATGTNHLIAISGLHIGLVAMLFFNAVKLLVRRSMLLTNIAPASFYGAIAAMLGALMYAALAGFSISTQRALIMVVVGMGAILLRRPVFSTKILALAWWGVFIWDPLAPLQMGFWLSFGCVSALLLGQSQMVNLSRWRKWLLPQWIVFIGLLPASVLFFQQIPLLSVLANAILIPLVSFVVVPLSLVAVLFLNFASPISQIFLELAHGALSLGWEYLRFLTKLPMSVYQQGYSSYLPIFLASIGAFLLLLPKGLPVRWLGWLGLLPLFFTSSALLTWGECRFTLLDVGQGLAAVIQTRHHTLLYDAGPQYGSADAGGRVIIPFLRTYNISNIDKVIISHGDLDHRAGLASLKNYSLGEVITSEPGRLTIASKLCEAPSQWEWEGVQFRLLSPTDLQQKNRNNLSCVLKVTAGEHSILLTGDIEKGAEKQLVALEEDALKSSILVVPHHGSLTSSSDDFIRRVLPQYALYPVGLGNHYGFPKQAILERYQAIGSQNLIVFETGALIFHLKPGNELTPPIHWRETSTQYWHVKQSGG